MKIEVIVSFVLLALFLGSMFPLIVSSRVPESHGAPGFSAAQPSPDSVNQWPMFRHDLTHTGYSTSTAPNTNQTLWNYTTSGPVGSSPAVAEGTVYVATVDGEVYALNASTGASVWNFTTGGSVWSSPAVADGMVFIGSDDNKLYALDASTGAPVWSYTTGAPVVSSPAVGDGIVYVGSDDSNVYAFGPGVHIHDVAVTSVATCKTVVGQGYSLNITVIAADFNETSETLNVTVYANTTSIASQNSTLSIGNSACITFTWNTTGFAISNYTVRAYAWLVPDETNSAENSSIDGTVYVGIPGDLNGDGTTNKLDAAALDNAFFATFNGSNWNPNADINGDGVVNILDGVILGNHFLQHYP